MPDEQLMWYLSRFVNLLIPYAVAAVGITLISITPAGRAAISWLKGHVNRGRAAGLSAEIDQLRGELADVQERLDFAERRLVEGAPTAAGHDARHLSPLEGSSRVPTPV